MLVDAFRFGGGGGGGAGYRSRLQFGGADGSTTFTDDTGKTWTAGGNAQIDTSLGDQRGLFDGTNSYISTPHHDPDLILVGDFKISFIQRYANKSGYQTIINKGYSPQDPNSWLVQTGAGDGMLNFYSLPAGSGATLVAAETTGTVNNNQDYQIEIERVGTTVTIKRDGATVATGSNSGTFGSVTALVIGGGSSTGINNYWFNGWMKDFFIQ